MAVANMNSRVASIVPRVADDRPLVEVRGLYKRFPVKGGILQRTVAEVKAVDGVDLDIRRGETLGLVGESGCGKTTVGRLILRLIEPSAGSIVFDGTDITKIQGARLKSFRRRMQIIFQDPYASLDPRAPIGDSIGDGLRIHGIGTAAERTARLQKMMNLVGLTAYQARRYPHEFSGGQRQRIGIARALIVEPDLVVCDEPVSALDVSIQAQVLNLLKELQRELGLTLLFIAHNMAVVEQAGRETTYADPRHPYTQALMSAIPLPDPDAPRQRIILRGDVPSPISIPTGCRFHPRCWLFEQLGRPENCQTVDPQLMQVAAAGDEHTAACHYSDRSRSELQQRGKTAAGSESAPIS